MAYESELALRLVPYTAGEQPKDRKFIKLNTNENPFPPSPRVYDALGNFMPETLRLYPDMDATSLCRAIAEVNGVEPDWVFCGNGSDEVLAFAFAAFFAGKNVAAPAVTYSFYPVYADLFGAKLKKVPMHPDFSVDVDGLMQGGPIALANPNAPTGLGLGREALRKLAQNARDNGQVLLVDEAYALFAREPATWLLREFDNVLISRTFSKSHSLAGMRVGYAMGHPRLIHAMKCIRDSFNSYPVDRIAQVAAEAAIRDTSYTNRIVAEICRVRDKCRDDLRAAGLTVLDSETNFLFVKADPVDAAHVQQALRAEGILVRHFGADNLKAWLRVSIGTAEDMAVVTEALIRYAVR